MPVASARQEHHIRPEVEQAGSSGSLALASSHHGRSDNPHKRIYGLHERVYELHERVYELHERTRELHEQVHDPPERTHDLHERSHAGATHRASSGLGLHHHLRGAPRVRKGNPHLQGRGANANWHSLIRSHWPGVTQLDSVWHVTEQRATQTPYHQKINAGADYIIHRQRVKVALSPHARVKSNLGLPTF